jgi:LysR family nitrogen assimilation transcriptional regulator
VLHISQPAIGEQIKNLEAELKANLLTRHSRGVEPTEAGRIFFNKAKAILEYVSEARAAVRDYEEGLRGKVTLGLTPGLSEAISASAIERCSRDYPGISINAIEDLSSSLLGRIANATEAISFAVVSGYDLPATQNIAAKPLFEESLYAVGSPKIIGKTTDPIKFEDLAQYRLILLGNGSGAQLGLKAQLEKIARASDVELSIIHEIQAISVVTQLVEREIGVAVLPLDAIRDSVSQGRLSARRIVSPSVNRELNLIWNSQRSLTAAEETIKNVVYQMILESRANPTS